MGLNTQQRAAIIAETRSWKGTPYRGWSCLKARGVDCGQVIYGIFHACGFIPELELPKDYSLQVSKHRASTEYINLVDQYFRPITEAEVQPGDLVVYKLGHAYAHAAIIEEWPRFVWQAAARHGFSGAHGTDHPAWKQRERIFRTLKDEYCEVGL